MTTVHLTCEFTSHYNSATKSLFLVTVLTLWLDSDGGMVDGFGIDPTDG